jgi:hypothetical protein
MLVRPTRLIASSLSGAICARQSAQVMTFVLG